MSDPVCLDYNATTPVTPAVAKAMLPFLRAQFGNPSSSHDRGQLAKAAVTEARRQVAALIGTKPEEIVFTGCATETNNLALLGVAAASGESKRHLAISAVEHPAVMQPALQLRQLGWDVSVIAVDSQGLATIDAMNWKGSVTSSERACRPRGHLVVRCGNAAGETALAQCQPLVANPIYREVLPRALVGGPQDSLPQLAVVRA